MKNVAAAVAVLLCVVEAPVAAVEGRTVLKRKGHDAELVDSVRYSEFRKAFVVKRGPASFVLTEEDVEFCRPPKPKGFDALGDSRAESLKRQLMAENGG